MDPAIWKCRQAQADADKDGVADDQDRCEGTPGDAAVDRSGCPRDEEEKDCKQWCQAKFDQRGLPGPMLQADSSTGEPPNCVCTCIDETGGLTANCVRRDCDQECRDKYRSNAKWDGHDVEHCTQCICQAGWKMLEQKCISCADHSSSRLWRTRGAMTCMLS